MTGSGFAGACLCKASANPFKTGVNLLKIRLEVFAAEARKFAELIDGDKLVFLFTKSLSDRPQHSLGVAYSSSGDDLDVFRIDDKPVAFHTC